MCYIPQETGSSSTAFTCTAVAFTLVPRSPSPNLSAVVRPRQICDSHGQILALSFRQFILMVPFSLGTATGKTAESSDQAPHTRQLLLWHRGPFFPGREVLTKWLSVPCHRCPPLLPLQISRLLTRSSFYLGTEVTVPCPILIRKQVFLC